MKVTEEMVIEILHKRIKQLEKAMNFMHDSNFLPYLKERLEDVARIANTSLEMVDEFKKQEEGKNERHD